MRHRWILASSTVVAVTIAAVLTLRPSRSIQRVELAPPAYIPAALRSVLKARMDQHGAQMGELIARLIVLDHAGAARVAGEIYDEPTLARPLAPDDLNQLLPPRFFALQDELRTQARKVVTVAAQGDTSKLADELGALTKVCVSCHATYLYEPSTRKAR